MGKGRAPCCAKVGLNKGSWTPEEDMRLVAYIRKYGHANWRALPKQAGLLRCGKSCRLRWINYLRPDLKRGNFTAEEEGTVIKLHALLGNKWSKIASCLPGRTDNEIKNVWNTHLKKRVAPNGEGRDARAKKKKEKKKEAASAEAPVPSSSSPSPSSCTTTTANCSSGDDSGEHQSNTSRGEPDELDLDKIEIPELDAAFNLDFLVDPVPTEPCCPCPAVSSVPASPCASSTSPPACARGVNDGLLDLLEIDIDQELWSIIDGDGAPAPAPCQGNATEANAASTASKAEEWSWLENLERELGLWGLSPMEGYYQHHMGPQGQVLGRPDPLPPMVEVDPVPFYFEAGPNPTPSTFQGPGPEYAAVLTSNQTGP